jgi:hypothetical protein
MNVTLPTPIGQLECVIVSNEDAMGISIRCNNIVIRGVTYHLSLYLKEQDGKLVESRDSTWLRRPDKKYNQDGPSDSARKIMMQAATTAAQEWWDANQLARNNIKHARLVREADAAASAIETARQAVAAAEKHAADKLAALKLWESHNTFTIEVRDDS